MRGIIFTIDALFSAFVTFLTIAMLSATFTPIETPSNQMTQLCWDVNTVLDIEGTISRPDTEVKSALSILLPMSLAAEMERTKYTWNGTDWEQDDYEIFYYPEGISGQREDAVVSVRSYMQEDNLYIAKLRCYRR